MLDRILEAHRLNGLVLGFTLTMLCLQCALLVTAVALLATGRPGLLLAFVAANAVVWPALNVALKLLAPTTALQSRGARLAIAKARRSLRAA